MSTGSPYDEQLASQISELVKTQMDEQAAFDARFREQQNAVAEKVGNVHNQLLANITTKVQGSPGPQGGGVIRDPQMID